ncbi:MAG: DUF1127 domain-containing protein [Pseudomonadota bacterium]
MEMHTPASLRQLHGLDAVSRRAPRHRALTVFWRWLAERYLMVRRAQANRRAYARLLNMSDRELKDIGLSRDAIVEALRQPLSHWKQ